MEMDTESQNLNLKLLEELIMDEEKIVTYIYLSKKLCIHVNDSKNMLTTFVTKSRLKQPDLALNINYLISGLIERMQGKTIVCPESELQQAKNNFNCIFFEHIYSVSKGTPTVDSAALASINSFANFTDCLGLIKGELCTKRSNNEMGDLRTNSYESSLSKLQQKQVGVPISKKIKVEPIQIVNSENGKVKEELKTNSIFNNKVNNKKGLAGFFTKNQSQSKKEVTHVKDTVENGHIKQEPQIMKESKTEVMDLKQEPQIKKEFRTEVMETDTIQPKSSDNNNSNSNGKQKTEKNEVVRKQNTKSEKSSNINKKDTKKSNKDDKNIKKTAKVDKKRKRVLQMSDSESDDEKNDPFVDEEPDKFSQHESEDEIPPTPANNIVKVTSGVLNPKKKRKTVDKTYTDEDGYILTKKEVVYESCSDNEVTTEVKENTVQVENRKIQISPSKTKVEPKKGKKKGSPPHKGKQPTLMNFFKKA